MSGRFVVLLLACLVTLASPLAAEEEPTQEQVLEALRTWSDGPAGERGESRIRTWGDRALPALRALAEGPEGRRHAHGISRAVQRVGTTKAADLLVDLLAGKTSVPGFMVLSTIETHPTLADPVFLRLLGEHEGFKDAVWTYARAVFRARIAKLSAAMGWMDTVPRIREMLQDRNLDVREAAAEALETLTGEKREVKRPDLALPATAELEGLLREAVALPTQGRRDADCVAALPWFDGQARLVYAFDPGLASRGDHGELCATTAVLDEPETWPMPYDLHALLSLPTPDAKRQLVGLVDDEEGEQSWQTVMAWNADGRELWRKRTDQRFMADIAPLYGASGPIGTLIGAGGETGLVAVDLAGKPLWDVPRQYVLYEVSTHPSLPGYALATGGSVTLFRHQGKEVGVHQDVPRPAGLFASHGVLFPDAAGEPAIVLAGKLHEGDLPTLRRIDDTGQTVWNAVFPVQIEGLALLEPRNGPRLLAVTTERGELFLLDDAGTLRWRGDMPGADPDDRVATYQLEAGEIGPGEYGVLVRLLRAAYLYPLDLDVLKTPGKR